MRVIKPHDPRCCRILASWRGWLPRLILTILTLRHLQSLWCWGGHLVRESDMRDKLRCLEPEHNWVLITDVTTSHESAAWRAEAWDRGPVHTGRVTRRWQPGTAWHGVWCDETTRLKGLHILIFLTVLTFLIGGPWPDIPMCCCVQLTTNTRQPLRRARLVLSPTFSGKKDFSGHGVHISLRASRKITHVWINKRQLHLVLVPNKKLRAGR